MKILHVSSFFIPALGYQEVYLAKHQALLGHRVTVLTSTLTKPVIGEPHGKWEFRQGHCAGETEFDGVTIIRLPTLLLSRRVILRGLLREIRRIDPDWIIVHGLTTLIGVQVCLWKRWNLIRGTLTVDDHTVYTCVRKDYVARLFYACLRTMIVPMARKACSDFVAITLETVRFLQEDLGIPRNLIRHVPLGADHIQFKFNEQSRSVNRRRFGFGDGDIVVLYAGKISRSKNVLELVTAVASMRGRMPNIKLLIVGAGSEEYIASIEREVAKRPGAETAIQIIPPVSNTELSLLLSVGDIGCWPGDESIVHIEAMAVGLPIIIKNLESLRERVQWRNGLLTDGTVPDIVQRLTTLAENEMLRTEMGRRGRDAVESSLSWQVIARRFEENPRLLGVAQ